MQPFQFSFLSIYFCLKFLKINLGGVSRNSHLIWHIVIIEHVEITKYDCVGLLKVSEGSDSEDLNTGDSESHSHYNLIMRMLCYRSGQTMPDHIFV